MIRWTSPVLTLTEDGRELLTRFDAYSAALREYAAEQFEKYFGGLF